MNRKSLLRSTILAGFVAAGAVAAPALAQEEEVDRKVRSKLASYSRGIIEGSAEWEVLYRKTFEEEMQKHARA